MANLIDRKNSMPKIWNAEELFEWFVKNDLVLSSFLRAFALWQRALSGNIFQGGEMMEKSFSEKVISIVVRIPKGRTLTYKEVARRAGNEKAARAVGNILNKYYKDCVKAGKKTIPAIELSVRMEKLGVM